jgi:hypothetical protein
VTEPSLAPIEDRLRRTFDVRAEDMAPGDADDGDPALPASLTGPVDRTSARRSRWSSRPVLAAAGVLVVALAAAAVAVVVGPDDDEHSQVATADDCGDGEPCTSKDPATIDLVIAPRALVDALETERDMASNELLGLTRVFELPVDNNDEARRETDAAIDAFGAVVSDYPARSGHRSAVDGLEGLAALRTQVDDFPGTRDVQNVEFAEQIAAEYEQHISGLLDAQRAFVTSIDDPDLRLGGELLQWGMQQRELTVQLVRAVLLRAVDYGASGQPAHLAQLRAEVMEGQDNLLAAATGTSYEEAAAALVGEVEDSDLLDIARSVAQGPVDVSGLLAARDNLEYRGWPDFLDRVEEILTAEG